VDKENEMATATMSDCEERDEPTQHEIEPALQTLLLAHPGKWAAITRSEIVAIGDDPRRVIEKARAAGVTAPILYRVPSESTTYWY
jgi:hypothetical protein